MKVNSISEAWKEVNKLFPYDYMKDEESSERAGYPIYRATAAEHQNNWISDLGTSLEINTEDGKSQRIWIEANIYILMNLMSTSLTLLSLQKVMLMKSRITWLKLQSEPLKIKQL